VFIVSGTLPNFSTLTEREFAELKESRPVLHWISANLQVYQLIRSPLFLILPGAIWLSTALCMIRRLRREIPRSMEPSRTRNADFGAAANVTIDRPLSSVVERISGILRGRRWQAEEVGENGEVHYFAQKGAQGFWGSVVFHLSMLVFLIGIIASILGRFDAEMILTEGQTFSFAEDQMLKVNGKGRLSPELPGTLVSLDRFESRFEQGKFPVDYAAHMSLMDGPLSIRKDTVRVNQPLKHDRWQIFLHRYGYAPRFEIRDRSEKLLFDSFVNLVFTEANQTDHFDVPLLPLRLEAQFVPENGKQGEFVVSRTPTPENPSLRIRAIADGEPIGEQEVLLGDTASFGAYVIKFAEMRQWAWFGIVYDPGYGLIIVAFTLCVAGLAHRFVFTEKWLQVKVEAQGDAALVSLTGRSRYFPALFEKEMQDIREQMATEAIATEANGDNDK
jgi:cytochrome c biogenesis protein ResB